MLEHISSSGDTLRIFTDGGIDVFHIALLSPRDIPEITLLYIVTVELRNAQCPNFQYKALDYSSRRMIGSTLRREIPRMMHIYQYR